MQKEYDFSKGARGKYAQRYGKNVNVKKSSTDGSGEPTEEDRRLIDQLIKNHRSNKRRR
jgi:hypothetical protein